MKRFPTSMILALALATLAAASAAAAGPQPNPNAGYVELDCTNGTQVIWVNFRASDLSNGGGVPAIEVSGDAGRVYKVITASVDGETFVTHFDGAGRFDRVVCTHESPYGFVTLTGVFIP
jgi:hypothetical protein